MALYTYYGYGSLNNVVGYRNRYNHTFTEAAWADKVFGTTDASKYKVYYRAWAAPSELKREGKGIVTGTLPEFTGAVHYLPFVQGIAVAEHIGKESDFMNNECYTSMSYFYSASRNFKVLIADDDSRNDGVFLLGCIALVDPYTYGKDLSKTALFCISSRYVNTTYIQTNTTNNPTNTSAYRGVNPTVTRTATGRYTLVYNNVGSSNYHYIWPLFQAQFSKDNENMYVTLKRIEVEETKTTLTVVTSDDESQNDACFRVLLLGCKYD